MDLSHCYMEQTAPYVLAGLFTSPHLAEIRWVTSLRLDGNYFANAGLSYLLSVMSTANEVKPIFPSLEQLYLNNMNLDATSVSGILFFLFPVDPVASKRFHSHKPPVSNEFVPQGKEGPQGELFPSLSILSLNDNPGLGQDGFEAVLTHLLSSHYKVHNLGSLDLSRCGIPAHCTKQLKQFLKDLKHTIDAGVYPIVPQRLVLLGNTLDTVKEKPPVSQVEIVM
ncbi:hypothetical protein STCU_00295 [Strigomonas culicis]|uniref:Leucine-rich domain-containing protein n=1 Tax=Strigomonas culicis TaxID=28005 RepID=S9V846_9TRYP|nr:hypothetical protein STCU_00295 [Strigomonas culicis]|eukprot:EPY37003.1 hypothetical protein STCU_00295 [Strigomonas culicis]